MACALLDRDGRENVAGRSIEHQHRARDLARLHRTESLVDVLKPPVTAYHVVEVQAALPVEFKILRHIEPETIGAHVAALDPLFDEEVAGVELDLLSRRNSPYQRSGAARRQAIKALLRHLPVADRLEGIIDAAFAQALDLPDRVARRGIDRVSGAEVFRHLELVIEQVNRDYLPGAGDARSLDDRKADASRAEHCHRGAGSDLRSIQGGADAGGYRASKQRPAVERYVVGDLEHGPLVQQHLFCEGCQIDKLMNWSSLLREPRPLARGALAVRAVGAQMWAPGQALSAVAAV